MRKSIATGRSLGAARVALSAWIAIWAIAAAGIGRAEVPAVEPGPEAEIQVGVLQADPRIGKVRALVAGDLDVSVAPKSLFDVPLSDEQALQVEAARIRTLLRAVDAEAESPPLEAGDSAGAGRAVTPAVGSLGGDGAGIDPMVWWSRLELDRARSEFYSLARARRDELLALHAARQEAARPRETEEEKRAREEEAERQRALEAARVARSEAERLVAEELVRLVGLEKRVDEVRARFDEERVANAARRDIVLGWQRRVRDAKLAGEDDADVTYDALRRSLREFRDDLAKALGNIAPSESSVPDIGVDPLVDVPPDIPTEAVRERRTTVQRAIEVARRDEKMLREERAENLLDEMSILNRERLELLTYLSAEKRGAITGFTAAGWDQARSEARHLMLILRYHRSVAETWLASQRGGWPYGISLRGAIGVSVPWLVLLSVFLWVRRRMPALVEIANERMRALDRAERRTTESRARRAIRILGEVHRPIEWLVFFVLLGRMLPEGARDLLEVQLLWSILVWVFGGALVIRGINAIAAGTTTVLVARDRVVDAVRLRSLQLVGRVIVVYALILELSARLVGEGTIYSWVLSTCWLAAVPVFLVLVFWWREIVFDRMERIQRKSRVRAWILSNRSGWKSFLAAMAGAVQLFLVGVLKFVRKGLSQFDFVRRVDAYRVKLELERRGQDSEARVLLPLSPEAADALHPERAFTKWLACPADDIRKRIAGQALDRRGGVFAVVGASGMGKSSLLRALQTDVPGSVAVGCHSHTSVEEIRAAACEPRKRDAATENLEPPSLVLLDEAQSLVKPVIGGLAKFDEVVAHARENCFRTIWVFAIDSALWPFLSRARDERPLFEKVDVLRSWNESQIGTLLADRCAAAGISPNYDDLLDSLPAGSDYLDRIQALKEKQAGYERMLWDHVRGNPGLALESWRTSLAVDAAGVVHVRPLQVSDHSMLDSLPDDMLFILRSILQLAPAAVDDVARATGLGSTEVLNAFRVGHTRGLLTREGDRMRIAWPWIRSVVALLERRHMLVNP